MPVSYHENYAAYQEWVKAHQPQSCIDVGMGYGNIGKYAKDIVPNIDLTGIEIFLPYFDSSKHPNTQAKHFDRIIISDVRKMINKLWSVDMVVAFDVIEHLPREDGIKVIKYLTSISNMGFLVNVPIVNYPQGPLYGNEAESHLDQWKPEELNELGGKTIRLGVVTGLFEFTK